MFYKGDKSREKEDRSLHAERKAILKCKDKINAKNLIVIRLKKTGLITGGVCCKNCCNFINKVHKKINLKNVYQIHSKEPEGLLKHSLHTDL